MSTSATWRKQERPGRLTFRIELPPVPELAAFCPPGNWIGMRLLHQLLTVALTARLPEAPEVVCGGDLSRTHFVIFASNLPAALDVVIGELRRVGLLGFAHIAWRDDDERVWRTHPAGRRAPDLLDDAALDTAGIMAALAEMLSINERLKACADRLDREAGGCADNPRQ